MKEIGRKLIDGYGEEGRDCCTESWTTEFLPRKAGLKRGVISKVFRVLADKSPNLEGARLILLMQWVVKLLHI